MKIVQAGKEGKRILSAEAMPKSSPGINGRGVAGGGNSVGKSTKALHGVTYLGNCRQFSVSRALEGGGEGGEEAGSEERAW